MIEKIIRYQLDTEENNLAILIFKNTNSTPEPFKFDSAWYRKKVSICVCVGGIATAMQPQPCPS